MQEKVHWCWPCDATIHIVLNRLDSKTVQGLYRLFPKISCTIEVTFSECFFYLKIDLHNIKNRPVLKASLHTCTISMYYLAIKKSLITNNLSVFLSQCSKFYQQIE